MSAVTFDLTVDPAFEANIQLVSERMMHFGREAMDKAMHGVATLTRAHRQAPWNKPGTFGVGKRSWEATGLAEESIQGYAVGVGEPHDLPSRVDRFGRTHDTNAQAVAPIPNELANDHTIIGVLTMTATYAPEESQSAQTQDDWFGGYRPGLQFFETGPSITLIGISDNEKVLVRDLQYFLETSGWGA